MFIQALYNSSLSVPRFLFRSSRYSGLSLPAKLVYALLLESLPYCKRRNWFDANGEIYAQLPQEAIGESLGFSRLVVNRAMKDLERYELIEIKQQGLCLPNRVYIHEPVLVPDEMSEDICQELLMG